MMGSAATTLLLMPLFVASALTTACQTGKCKTVGSAEICTEFNGYGLNLP
ncbi:Hypothetical protein DHA2_151185 [Giardia duodenalis]|uniref:Variant-specific surface protein n=1 Tax=Giardia intestinalis TaxID=5741 RepID=V6TRI4_GIAIN|nr:Hypothetical protein DHA2_151185 [Giardia intestinalis]